MSILKTFCIWIYFILLLFLTPIALLFLLCPLLVTRLLVSLIAKTIHRFRNGRMIGKLCGLHAVDEFTLAPVGNLLVSMYMEGQVDIDLLKAHFITNVLNKTLPTGRLQYPELYSYITEFSGFSFWTRDENFNAENHFIYYDCGKVVNEIRLQELRNQLLRSPWEPRRPLWKFIIVESYQSGNHGDHDNGAPGNTYTPVVFFLAHHVLLDGYSLINILVEDMANVDLQKVIAQPVPHSKKQKMGRKQNDAFTIWRKLSFPICALYEFAVELNKAPDVNPWNQPNMKYNKTGTFTFANPIPIDYIKQIKNGHGVSFTSVILAGICGGIRNEMEAAFGHANIPPFINSFAVLPVKRHPKKLTNHLTHSIFQLPTGIGDPTARLRKIEETIQNLKKSNLPILNFYLAQILGSFPRIILKKFFSKNFPATVAVSNFPAPNEIWTLNGTNVYRIQFEAGPMLALGIGYCCLSYNGYLSLFAGVDSAIPNSSIVSKGLVKNFELELSHLNDILEEQ